MQDFYRPCVLVCWLLATLPLVFAVQSGSFRRPSTNSDERFLMIQNELIKVQNDVMELNVALVSGDTSQALKARMSMLENQFESLKTQLLDEGRRSSAVNGKYDSAIATLTNFCNGLDTQLKKLQASLEKRDKEEATRRLPTRVAEEIRSRRYSEAENLLIEMNDKDELGKLPSIIHSVFANSPGNTDLIIDFAKGLKSIELTAYVLTALWLEMKSNNIRDPYKMMNLGRAAASDIVMQPNASDDAKLKALQLIRATLLSVTDTASETLKAAVYSNNYQKNVQVENLANAISDFNDQVSDTVMERVVNETYPTISADRLADDIYSNKYISQIVSGLVALFYKLESHNNLSDKSVLKIAHYLKRLKGMTNYANIEESKKAAVEAVIEKMPTCAKNLFFASSVCLWNKGKSEYLYAASSPYNWNQDRRSIFTWGSGMEVTQGTWYAERYDDDEYFYFKSKAHKNEYMYAAGVGTYDAGNRYVLTWIEGGGGIIENKAAWEVELYGDYCFLRNKHYNEYLYASDKMHSHYRRYVFTWIPGTSNRESAFQWQIRDCD